MSVLLETSIGEIVIDLYTKKAPKACENFLKLCKIKYYNFHLFHTVLKEFTAQSGDPTGTGKGGESVWGVIHGKDRRYFTPEFNPKLKHDHKGVVSMATAEVNEQGLNVAGSQFFITLTDAHLDYLDGKQAIFGEVAEGLEILDKINQAITDEQGRPYQDIRILHTIILDDPFDDPPGLVIPDHSPLPTEEMLASNRIGIDESLEEDISPEELEKRQRAEEAAAQALTLEMVGDLPFAEIKPPENVLFVCKLNPVTRDEDLELIFSRFGKILSCEIIRDKKTNESLCYAFIEFEEKESAEEAYFKMDNVLIDDRRIHVDFSQSVSKLHQDFMMGKRGRLEDYGDGLEKRRRYRDGGPSRQEDEYDLVFEHEGNLSTEKSRHSHKSSERSDRRDSRKDESDRFSSRRSSEKEYPSKLDRPRYEPYSEGHVKDRNHRRRSERDDREYNRKGDRRERDRDVRDGRHDHYARHRDDRRRRD